MTRFLIAATLALAASSPVFAQDMPLSQILIDGEGWKKGDRLTVEERKELKQWKTNMGLADLSAFALSPDQSVIYLATEGRTYVGAAQVHGPEGSIFGRENEYCPLRMGRRDRTGGCTALCVDRDGRIYAATPLGVQVFDPTGRLCGVMTAPQDRVEYMDLEGDKLTLWIGDTKHTRKLNARATEGPRKKQ